MHMQRVRGMKFCQLLSKPQKANISNDFENSVEVLVFCISVNKVYTSWSGLVDHMSQKRYIMPLMAFLYETV